MVKNTRKIIYKTPNWLMKTKNGIVISKNSAYKLIESSLLSWADLFDED